MSRTETVSNDNQEVLSTEATRHETISSSTEPSPHSETESTGNSVSGGLKQINIEEYIYPGSKVKNTNSNSIELISEANPDEVVEWYRNKLDVEDRAVQSLVTTKTNGKVLNLLSASMKDNTLDIVISSVDNTTGSEITLKIK